MQAWSRDLTWAVGSSAPTLHPSLKPPLWEYPEVVLSVSLVLRLPSTLPRCLSNSSPPFASRRSVLSMYHISRTT